MIKFLVSSGRGWGTGASLSLAMQEHNKHNDKIKSGERYYLAIFQSQDDKDFEITMDELTTTVPTGVKKIYSNSEFK